MGMIELKTAIEITEKKSEDSYTGTFSIKNTDPKITKEFQFYIEHSQVSNLRFTLRDGKNVFLSVDSASVLKNPDGNNVKVMVSCLFMQSFLRLINREPDPYFLLPSISRSMLEEFAKVLQ
ncbi:MAG: hypothetical protein Q8P95_05445 [bacterium]|nr:hypothetical protein [bacterium]